MRSTSLIAACVCGQLASAALEIVGNAEARVRREDAPTAPDIAPDCTGFVTVMDSSQDCRHLLDKWAVSHDEFIKWNPSVKSDCSGLKVGHLYCVELARADTEAFPAPPCDVFEALGTTPVKYESRGGVFEMSKAGQAPTLRSHDYIFFGRVEVEMQAAPGKGVISCLVLQSDDLDEIDFETVGSDTKQIQTNYFYKGDTTTYDRGAFHPVDDILTMHTYALDWTPDKLEWLIDGKVQRTVRRAEIGDYKYPQGPMQVKLGTWVAGYQGNSPGTIKWAGGIADFSNGPSSAIFKTIKITDYSGGYGATSKDVKEYVYGDRSGSASSIHVKLGDGSSGSSGSSGNSATNAATSEATVAQSISAATSSSTTAPTTAPTTTFMQNTTTTTNNTNTTAGTVPTSTTTPPVSGAAGRNPKAVGAVLAAVVAAFALKTWHSS